MQFKPIAEEILLPILDGHPEGMDLMYYKESLQDVLSPILNGERTIGRSLSEYLDSISNIIEETESSKEFQKYRKQLADGVLADLFHSLLLEWRHELLRRVWDRHKKLRMLRSTGHTQDQAKRRAKGEGAELQKWRAERLGSSIAVPQEHTEYYKELKEWERIYRKLEMLMSTYGQPGRDEVRISHVFPNHEGHEHMIITPAELAEWLPVQPSSILVADPEGADRPAIKVFHISPIPQEDEPKPVGLVQMVISEQQPDDILAVIRAAIIRRAMHRHGEDGRIVMRSLLEDSDHTSAVGTQRRGPPEDAFTTKASLWLDRYCIPRKYIGMLLSTLEGASDLDPVKQGRRIGMQIKKHGGNTLRYVADRSLKRWDRCTSCGWAWDRSGKLVIVHPCGEHPLYEDDEPIVFFIREGVPHPQTNDWLNEMLGLRDESHFSNALAWLIPKCK